MEQKTPGKPPALRGADGTLGLDVVLQREYQRGGDHAMVSSLVWDGRRLFVVTTRQHAVRVLDLNAHVRRTLHSAHQLNTQHGIVLRRYTFLEMRTVWAQTLVLRSTNVRQLPPPPATQVGRGPTPSAQSPSSRRDNNAWPSTWASYPILMQALHSPLPEDALSQELLRWGSRS